MYELIYLLGLQDNLWMCDCRLALLLELSRATESYLVLLDRFLICSGPKNFSGVPFQSVELPRCLKPSVLTSTTKIITPLGSNVMVRCEATGFPTPVLIWIKSAGPNISTTGAHIYVLRQKERQDNVVFGYSVDAKYVHSLYKQKESIRAVHPTHPYITNRGHCLH